MISERQKYWRTSCFFAAFLILMGCVNHDMDELPAELTDPEFIDPLDGLPDEGAISFQDPEIGQRSSYVFFEVTYKRATDNVEFKYHADTLIVAITGKEASRWIVKEFLAGGSISRLEPENSSWGMWADSIFVNHLEVNDDSVRIFREGNIPDNTFSLLARQKFPLPLVIDNVPENTRALPFFVVRSGRWMEYTKNFVRPGKTYNKLNIFFDYSSVETDGPGFMFVYGPDDGLVRSTTTNPWVPDEAIGWDLIVRQ